MKKRGRQNYKKRTKKVRKKAVAVDDDDKVTDDDDLQSMQELGFQRMSDEQMQRFLSLKSGDASSDNDNDVDDADEDHLKKKQRTSNWKSIELPRGVLETAKESGFLFMEELQDVTVVDGSERHQQKNKKKKQQQSKSKLKIVDLNASTSESGTMSSSSSSKVKVLELNKSDKDDKNDKKKKVQKKIETNVKVDEKQKQNVDDDNGNDYDDSAWDGLGLEAGVKMTLVRDLKFAEPTPIQRKCLPLVLRDRKDVVAAAQTGSGKTLAFGLPIVQAILNDKAQGRTLRGLFALILVPTRELAMQVSKHLESVARRCTDVRVVTIVGGMAEQKQQRLLRKCPEIVVATPGRLWALLSDNKSEHLADVGALRFLVLDEADRMVERGHFAELTHLIRFLSTRQAEAVAAGAKSKVKRRQTLVFSATMTIDPARRAGVVQRQSSKSRRKAASHEAQSAMERVLDELDFGRQLATVDLSREQLMAERLDEAKIECVETEKDFYLAYCLMMLAPGGRTLVFTNSIDCVRRLLPMLTLMRIDNVCTLHAEMTQRQRLNNIDRFHREESSVLIATDVAARGLDIPRVACVIHYQVPRTVELYVHRSGRTARGTAGGLSIEFVSPKERAIYRRCHANLGRASAGLPELPVDGRVFGLVRKRVSLARRIDQREHTRRRTEKDNEWFRKNALECDIELSSDDDVIDEPNPVEERRALAEIASMRAQLEQLLSQPIGQHGFHSARYVTVSNTPGINLERTHRAKLARRFQHSQKH
jgi:ATP-dependent RNA helicase DDX24/MAK5